MDDLYTFETNECPECTSDHIYSIDHDSDVYDTGRTRTRWLCDECAYDWWTFDDPEE